jgi:phosphoserine aminotransferase
MGGDHALTDEFLIQSWSEGMVGLRTLTPFGAGEYLRASLYNAITVEDTSCLAEFMLRFAAQNSA